MVEELKGKIIATDSQTSKIHEELKQKAEDTQLELEKLLVYVKLQEDEVNTQKNLVLEKQQMFQKFEEEVEEETKHLKEKIQELENNSLELQQLLHLKEEENQQNVESVNDAEQLKIIPESQIKALQREKAELIQKLQSTAEDVKYISQEKERLRTEVEALQAEKDNMTQTVHRLGETIERLVPANLELQEQLRDANNSLREHKEMVEELKGKIIATDSQTSKIHEELKKKTEDSQLELEKLLVYVKSQEDEVNTQKNLVLEKQQTFQKFEEEIKEETKHLKEKIIKSNEEISSLTEEKKHLSAELREQEKYVQQLMKENTLLQEERDDLQQVMQSIREENKSQLQETLPENIAKDSEMNIKEEKQDCLETLEVKIFRIMEVLKKFPVLEKRSEYFINISLQIKNQFDSKKALVAKWLSDISPQEADNIKRLQMEYERINNSLYNLLNKLQYFFTCLCNRRTEYYTNVSKYTRELFDERRNQHELLMQIHRLRKPHLEQQGAGSQQSGVSGLIQSLDDFTEQILKEASEMEEELSSTEVMLQELERENIEMEQYLERCSDYFDIQDFEARIKQNNEKLLSIGRSLKPKVQPYFQARSELEARSANYCREIDATLKACREETKELILQLDMLKKEQKSCGVANMALEEENHKLAYKLKATEQDIKNLKLKIQELESVANKAGKDLQEKEKIIAILEMKLKVRASRSEVVRLQAALEEKEHCLRNTITERETLKAQVDKGVGLYREEIEVLRTQLAKADMARMKQSKLFDQEMANAKALADHREEQIRKLKEELRKAQQDHDVTVMSNKDLPRPSLPITCGGGSGIVQNTQMLVLKSEHAKLEKEHAQLKKEHELLLTNELILKEEIKKWKERAMKRRERTLGDTSEEQKIKSPRKVAAPSLSALPASPCRERSMQPILPLDTPQSMPLNCPTNFFDNSRLGIIADTRSGRTESEENSLKHWLSTEDKEDVSNCKTQ
ncbi:centromere-associated protein E-like [Python bivittatus]|uniref:Centromere-associated protein E-like n=1 Tax=Python bivittatus TaxID=176946 RepID=A0A9F2WKG7_PYTBI|nr:centromere-associated protein E-like [Python bivittatus]